MLLAAELHDQKMRREKVLVETVAGMGVSLQE